jgi:hypothetical protein
MESAGCFESLHFLDANWMIWRASGLKNKHVKFHPDDGWMKIGYGSGESVALRASDGAWTVRRLAREGRAKERRRKSFSLPALTDRPNFCRPSGAGFTLAVRA